MSNVCQGVLPMSELAEHHKLKNQINEKQTNIRGSLSGETYCVEDITKYPTKIKQKQHDLNNVLKNSCECTNKKYDAIINNKKDEIK